MVRLLLAHGAFVNHTCKILYDAYVELSGTALHATSTCMYEDIPQTEKDGLRADSSASGL